jgi:acyl-CoA synthetase (AMP-forming)/AMP-acid ligase II
MSGTGADTSYGKGLKVMADGKEGPGLRGDRIWKTIGGLLAAASAAQPDADAVVDADRTLTFRELEEEAQAFARALVAQGLRRGDRISVWAPNRWRFMVATLGAHLLGAALVPINTRYKGSEAAYILDQAQPSVLVVVPEFLGVDYLSALEGAGWLGSTPSCKVVLIDDVEDPRGTSWSVFVEGGSQVDPAEPLDRLAELNGDDISDVLFTSGTTGRPKGVLTTHSQNLRAYYDWSSIAGFEAGDRYAIINPFFHSFGYKVGWLSALMHGITIFPHATLDVRKLLRQVEEERISLLPGPPALYQSLFEEVKRGSYDLSSLRLAVTGAAAIAPSLVERMKSELGFSRVTTCYGMSEGNGIATITRAGDDLLTVASTSGRALPGVELKIVADGKPVPSGEPGEVWVRGYNVMRCYLAGPEQTAEAVDVDGWLHSGDIGRMDENSNLSVADRVDDMFTVGGFNTYPAEIENTMAAHKLISQVAVVGRPDERLGFVPHAFVVLTDGAEIEQDELISWCREYLANFKVPRGITFADELPRNATGKVLKHELRARAEIKEQA